MSVSGITFAPIALGSTFMSKLAKIIFAYLSLTLSTYANSVPIEISEIYDDTISLLSMQSFRFGEYDSEVGHLQIIGIYEEASNDQLIKEIDLLERRLNQIPNDEQNKLLWVELANVLKSNSIYYNQCRIGDLYFINDWVVYRYLEYITNHWEDLDEPLQVKSYEFFNKALRNFTLLLDKIKKQINKLDDNFLIPSKKSLSDYKESLIYLKDRSYLSSLLDSLEKNYTCPSCERFPREQFIEYFDNHIGPLLDEVDIELDSLIAKAEDIPYMIPRTVKERCMRSVMYNVAGLMLTPEEISELGKNELQKAEKKMLEIMRNFLNDPDLSLSAMNDYIRETSQTDQYEDAQDYLESIDEMITRTEAFLPLVTTKKSIRAKVHDLDYDTDSFSESYGECTIYVNNKAPSSKYELASLMIHEGVPGHHLDHCKENSSDEFPERTDKLSRYHHNIDRAEGWAFYMEEVADELGFYINPMERIGYLDWVRARSLRLISTYQFFFEGWSWDEVKAYKVMHSSISEHSLNSETNRATGWNGQVLNYLAGSRAIKEMRKEAEGQLGDNFDLIAFHDFILRYPKYSLAAIRVEFKRWLRDQK